jgi:predicted HicB family RNase H-like nuclease
MIFLRPPEMMLESDMQTMMTYKGFEAAVEYDDDAEIFHGEAINLRDVITFQARSASELNKAFAGSVEDYLAFCKESGA